MDRGIQAVSITPNYIYGAGLQKGSIRGAKPNTNILVRAPRDQPEAELELFMLTFEG